MTGPLTIFRQHLAQPARSALRGLRKSGIGSPIDSALCQPTSMPEATARTPAYAELCRVYARLYRYNHLSAIVGWDRNAMMPPKGNEARAAAEAELNALIHRTRTDPCLAGWLREAEHEPLDAIERANLREMRRDWRDANALPEWLVEAKTLA